MTPTSHCFGISFIYFKRLANFSLHYNPFAYILAKHNRQGGGGGIAFSLHSIKLNCCFARKKGNEIILLMIKFPLLISNVCSTAVSMNFCIYNNLFILVPKYNVIFEKIFIQQLNSTHGV